MAGGRGFEPRLTESESAVLPLDDPPGSFDLEAWKTKRIEMKSQDEKSLGAILSRPGMEGAGAREALLMPAFVIIVIARESFRSPLREIPCRGSRLGCAAASPGPGQKVRFTRNMAGLTMWQYGKKYLTNHVFYN